MRHHIGIIKMETKHKGADTRLPKIMIKNTPIDKLQAKIAICFSNYVD